MLFLLNDAVLSLSAEDLHIPLNDRALAALRMDAISGLCAEMFSANPILHRADPARARKLAALIVAKSPAINAALFVPVSPRCPIDRVTCRYAEVTIDVMSGLFTRQQQGRITTADADDQVWRRLAA